MFVCRVLLIVLGLSSSSEPMKSVCVLKLRGDMSMPSSPLEHNSSGRTTATRLLLRIKNKNDAIEQCTHRSNTLEADSVFGLRLRGTDDVGPVSDLVDRDVTILSGN